MRRGSARLDAAKLPEHAGGGLHLGIHGAIHALGADDGLQVRERLLVAPLLEEQLPEREAGTGEPDEVLGGDGGVDGVAEGGLGHLGLASVEKLAGALEVFLDVHGVKGWLQGKGEGLMDEKRLAELEIRYMQQQELLQELSDVLYQQQKLIDGLRLEVEHLKQKLEAEPGLVEAQRQERPPHY